MTNISPLTLTHLRFDCIAQETVKLNDHRAGDYLRNALASVMLRSVCPETRRDEKPTPEHAAVCPVCWLLAAEIEPGRVHRAYALVPPIPPRQIISPGERFSFVLTLFGEDGFSFLSYLVLAVPEISRGGIGPGRGRFALDTIWASNPLTNQVEPVLLPGQNLVRVPELSINWDDIESATRVYLCAIKGDDTLTIYFQTPTRLVQAKKLLRAPDFGVFFRRLLKRIDELSGQFARQPRRPRDDIDFLHALADRVRLVDTKVRWVDLKSFSGRTRRHTPMGGFVGTATYHSLDWDTLLPWLILGQGTQVGKVTVKGNGVYEIMLPGVENYWQWVT